MANTIFPHIWGSSKRVPTPDYIQIAQSEIGKVTNLKSGLYPFVYTTAKIQNDTQNGPAHLGIKTVEKCIFRQWMELEEPCFEEVQFIRNEHEIQFLHNCDVNLELECEGIKKTVALVAGKVNNIFLSALFPRSIQKRQEPRKVCVIQ